MVVGVGTNLPSLLYRNFLDPLGTYSGGMISNFRAYLVIY